MSRAELLDAVNARLATAGVVASADQESKIEGFQTEIEALTKQQQTQQNEMEAFLNGLNVG